MCKMKMLKDQNGNEVYDVGNGHIYKRVSPLMDYEGCIGGEKVEDMDYPIFHWDINLNDFITINDETYKSECYFGNIIHFIEVGYLGDFVKQSLER